MHQATGIPKSTISEVLAGKKPFSRLMIRKLAEYFGVDVAVLAANVSASVWIGRHPIISVPTSTNPGGQIFPLTSPPVCYHTYTKDH